MSPDWAYVSQEFTQDFLQQCCGLDKMFAEFG